MRPTSSLSCGSFGLTARYCDGEFLCCAVGKFCQVCCALLFMDCSPEVRALEGWSHRSCLRRKLKVLPNIQTRLSCWFELGDVWATVWHSYSLFHPPYGVVFRCEELSHTHTPLWISYFKQRVFPQQKHSLPWTYQILKNPLHIHCSPLFIPSFAPFSSMPSGFWPCPVPQNVQHTAQGCSSEDDGGTKTPHLEVYLEKASNIHRWFFYVRRFSSIFSPYSSNSLLMQEAKRHAQMELSTLCLQWSWLCSTMAGGTEKRQTLRLTILIDSIWHAGILGFLMR